MLEASSSFLHPLAQPPSRLPALTPPEPTPQLPSSRAPQNSSVLHVSGQSATPRLPHCLYPPIERAQGVTGVTCPRPESQSVGSELGGVGKGLPAGTAGRGAEARGSSSVTQQWSPTLGQLNLAPMPAVLRSPLFLAGGRRKIRRKLAQPPGPGVTCWPKPGGGEWWIQALLKQETPK